jgi:hypothetical protein
MVLRYGSSFLSCRKRLLNNRSKVLSLDYFNLKHKFNEDYDRENPCTKELATRQLMEEANETALLNPPTEVKTVSQALL